MIHLESEDKTLAAGDRLARMIRERGGDGYVIHLVGDLGAGKTTFVRGLLRGLGHAGRVPSPTYTLVEPYDLAGYSIAHVDLYRLRTPGEAAALALDELCGERALLLIEWPEHGGHHVPSADLRIELSVDGDGRGLRVTGLTPAGVGLASAALE